MEPPLVIIGCLVIGIWLSLAACLVGSDGWCHVLLHTAALPCSASKPLLSPFCNECMVICQDCVNSVSIETREATCVSIASQHQHHQHQPSLSQLHAPSRNLAP